MKFLFWNIQDAYNQERLDYLNETKNSFDIIILAEAPGDFFDTRVNKFELLNGFNKGSSHIKVFRRKNLKGATIQFKETLFRERISVFELIIDTEKPILLFCVHLKSKALIDEKTQLLTNVLASNELHGLHDSNSKRSIVVGDFNHNPFETLVSSNNGINCISSKNLISHLKYRSSYYRKKDIFFNPMWKFYNPDYDFHGTYFYKKEYHKKVDDFHWNLYDQVVISRDIMNSLDLNSLAIVTKYFNSKKKMDLYFAHEKYYPIYKTFMNPLYSDHLPITFTIDIKKLN